MFFVFRDSYVQCIYVMNILCTFHISLSGYGIVRFGLISLFNGISTIIDYFMPKSSCKKNISGAI